MTTDTDVNLGQLTQLKQNTLNMYSVYMKWFIILKMTAIKLKYKNSIYEYPMLIQATLSMLNCIDV